MQGTKQWNFLWRLCFHSVGGFDSCSREYSNVPSPVQGPTAGSYEDDSTTLFFARTIRIVRFMKNILAFNMRYSILTYSIAMREVAAVAVVADHCSMDIRKQLRSAAAHFALSTNTSPWIWHWRKRYVNLDCGRDGIGRMTNQVPWRASTIEDLLRRQGFLMYDHRQNSSITKNLPKIRAMSVSVHISSIHVIEVHQLPAERRTT